MMGKTHVAIGMASTMLVLHPLDIPGCIVALSGGALGGVIADIDILDNDYKHDALIGQCLSMGTAGISLFVDYIMKYGVYDSVLKRNRVLVLVGLFIYFSLCIIGFISNHRTFTHSILGLFLFSTAMFMICPKLVAPYGIGYLSHLLLDVLNKKKVLLLYTIGKGFCLKFFYAGKIADKIFMWLGFACTIVLVMYVICWDIDFRVTLTTKFV